MEGGKQRESTVFRTLSKKQLHIKIIDSIRNAGWNVRIDSNIDKWPLKLYITQGEYREFLLVYIWNISHGGKTRDPEEYRIQLKGSGLTVGESFKTLLFGWFEEKGVFAAFDAFLHKEFGQSPSVQVTIITLLRAIDEGIAFQTKQTKRGQDIVVTFIPENIIEYIRDIYPEYHKNEMDDISESEMNIVNYPLDTKIPDAELDKIPKERRSTVRKLNKKVRDARFQRYIQQLYEGKCAICGLQARLTEAAHIVPVKDEGTDELVNGLLLCRNHHKAFDAGLILIDEEYRISLNEPYAQWLSDTSKDNKLKEFIDNSRIGEKITIPENEKYHPNKDYLIEKLKGVQFLLF